MELVLTMRSGAHVVVRVKSVRVTLSLTGELQSLEWDHGEDSPSQLRYVDPDEVVCVVTRMNSRDGEKFYDSKRAMMRAACVSSGNHHPGKHIVGCPIVGGETS